MDIYVIQVIIARLMKEISAFYHSSTFFIIEILVAIYVIIVLLDVILLLVQRGIGNNWRQMRFGLDMPSELVNKKYKIKESWIKIKKRLESDNEAEYKVAIIEADLVIDDLIKRIGYKGDNMAERLANIPEGQLNESEMIKEAHEIRNRIIHEDDLVVDREFATEVLLKYEHLLNYFEVLD